MFKKSASETLPTLRRMCKTIFDSQAISRNYQSEPSSIYSTRTKGKHKLTPTVNKCQALKYMSNSYSSYRIKAVDDLTEGPLTKTQASDLVLRLTEVEREALQSALKDFEAKKVKSEFEGQLAASQWRSKFGRPSKIPSLGDVDPTGSYCHLPEDWLKKKYAESVPPPTLKQLTNVAVYNAVPFIGFGFLDNAIMIIAGDYIELYLGSMITISTMAAAALGNTISDVMGIGSAWYVELLASKVGLKAPNLSPIQLDLGASRRFANLGRAVGIVIGCLLGMLPLLFMNAKEEDKEKKAEPKNT